MHTSMDMPQLQRQTLALIPAVPDTVNIAPCARRAGDSQPLAVSKRRKAAKAIIQLYFSSGGLILPGKVHQRCLCIHGDDLVGAAGIWGRVHGLAAAAAIAARLVSRGDLVWQQLHITHVDATQKPDVAALTPPGAPRVPNKPVEKQEKETTSAVVCVAWGCGIATPKNASAHRGMRPRPSAWRAEQPCCWWPGSPIWRLQVGIIASANNNHGMVGLAATRAAGEDASRIIIPCKASSAICHAWWHAGGMPQMACATRILSIWQGGK